MSDLRIEVRSPDGRAKYRWPVRELERDADWLLAHGEWGRELAFLAQGTEAPVTNRSLECYWLDRAYAVTIAYDEEGRLQEFYGRVVRPPEWDPTGETLVLVALGLDLQITPELDYEILEHGDPDALATSDGHIAREGLMGLVELVERREGPFDPETRARYEALLPS